MIKPSFRRRLAFFQNFFITHPPPLAVTDTRIDERIEQISNQRTSRDSYNGDRDAAQDHVVIRLHDGTLYQSTDAGIPEDDLRHDGTVEDTANAHGQCGDLCQDRVAEYIAVSDLSFGQTAVTGIENEFLIRSGEDAGELDYGYIL